MNAGTFNERLQRALLRPFAVALALAGIASSLTISIASPSVVQPTITKASSSSTLSETRPTSTRGLSAHIALSNVAPMPAFISSCASSLHSASCVNAEIEAINNARFEERLAAVRVNQTAFVRLSPTDQVFAATNLERIARGLAPVNALSKGLDAAARLGAARSVDPRLSTWSLPGGRPVLAWAANWAGGLDALQSDYLWMYDDGVGDNVDCRTASESGCWAHRTNILIPSPTVAACHGAQPDLVMGVAIDPSGFYGSTGIAELLTASCGGLPSDATVRWTAVAHRIGIRVS